MGAALYRRRWSNAATGLLIATLIALSFAASAAASPGPGPSNFGLGMVDDLVFIQAPPAPQSLWLTRARAAGSSYVRIAAWWNLIAPDSRPHQWHESFAGDPNYRWSDLDRAVRAAVAHGQQVTLMAVYAPLWAQGPNMPARGVRPGTWMPIAADFGAFGHALAERYSGHFPDPLNTRHHLPHVRFFQAWNEPNLPAYITPQWARTNGGPWQPIAADVYRPLLNAFYSGVKSAQRRALVLAAGTAPYGDPPGTAGGRMRPATFFEALFCLTPSLRPTRCGDPPRFDVVDHHPYGLSPTGSARDGGDIAVPDVYKIRRILNAAQRYHHAFPAGPKSIWITEIDWSSGSPGAPSSPELQVRYTALGFYELWRQGVNVAFWYDIVDDPLEVSSFRGSGLYYGDGVAKPAVAAFRFPFVALSNRQRRIVLWGRAPSPGTVVIQRLVRGRWRRFDVLRTTSGGIFYSVRPHPRTPQPRLFRAVIGHDVSPVWVNG